MVRVVNARDMYACLYRVTNGRLAAGCRYIHCSISIYARDYPYSVQVACMQFLYFSYLDEYLPKYPHQPEYRCIHNTST